LQTKWFNPPPLGGLEVLEINRQRAKEVIGERERERDRERDREKALN